MAAARCDAASAGAHDGLCNAARLWLRRCRDRVVDERQLLDRCWTLRLIVNDNEVVLHLQELRREYSVVIEIRNVRSVQEEIG